MSSCFSSSTGITLHIIASALKVFVLSATATIGTLEKFEEVISSEPDFFGSKIKDIITLDGMRIVFEQGGFALIRQSNTEPVFTLRFEATDCETARRYEELMVNRLLEIIKEQAINA